MTETAQKDKVYLPLDPEFIETLQAKTSQYAEALSYADHDKWSIAMLVNGMWQEHQSIFSGNKLEYYVECSRVANDGLSVRIFGESGQTLRRWCEVQETYSAMPQAEEFLEALSFDHLARARKLARDGKVPAPDYALARAVQDGLSADDMQEMFDPAETPHPYDVISSHLAFMRDMKNWEFIKSVEMREKISDHVCAINMIVDECLRREGKAL